MGADASRDISAEAPDPDDAPPRSHPPLRRVKTPSGVENIFYSLDFDATRTLDLRNEHLARIIRRVQWPPDLKSMGRSVLEKLAAARGGDGRSDSARPVDLSALKDWFKRQTLRKADVTQLLLAVGAAKRKAMTEASKSVRGILEMAALTQTYEAAFTNASVTIGELKALDLSSDSKTDKKCWKSLVARTGLRPGHMARLRRTLRAVEAFDKGTLPKMEPLPQCPETPCGVSLVASHRLQNNPRFTILPEESRFYVAPPPQMYGFMRGIVQDEAPIHASATAAEAERGIPAGFVFRQVNILSADHGNNQRSWIAFGVAPRIRFVGYGLLLARHRHFVIKYNLFRKNACAVYKTSAWSTSSSVDSKRFRNLESASRLGFLIDLNRYRMWVFLDEQLIDDVKFGPLCAQVSTYHATVAFSSARACDVRFVSPSPNRPLPRYVTDVIREEQDDAKRQPLGRAMRFVHSNVGLKAVLLLACIAGVAEPWASSGAYARIAKTSRIFGAALCSLRWICLPYRGSSWESAGLLAGAIGLAALHPLGRLAVSSTRSCVYAVHGAGSGVMRAALAIARPFKAMLAFARSQNKAQTVRETLATLWSGTARIGQSTGQHGMRWSPWLIGVYLLYRGALEPIFRANNMFLSMWAGSTQLPTKWRKAAVALAMASLAVGMRLEMKYLASADGRGTWFGVTDLARLSIFGPWYLFKQLVVVIPTAMILIALGHMSFADLSSGPPGSRSNALITGSSVVLSALGIHAITLPIFYSAPLELPHAQIWFSMFKSVVSLGAFATAGLSVTAYFAQKPKNSDKFMHRFRTAVFVAAPFAIQSLFHYFGAKSPVSMLGEAIMAWTRTPT